MVKHWDSFLTNCKVKVMEMLYHIICFWCLDLDQELWWQEAQHRWIDEVACTIWDGDDPEDNKDDENPVNPDHSSTPNVEIRPDWWNTVTTHPTMDIQRRAVLELCQQWAGQF